MYCNNIVISFDLTYNVIVFVDFAQAQLRQYDRLTKQMKPDIDSYEKTKEKLYILCFTHHFKCTFVSQLSYLFYMFN